jgi:phosphoserine phosphatase RsbU/P
MVMNEQIKENRILIVDDTPENVDILGEILKDYKKQVALNGEKALKIAFGENKPDLILLDVMMPGMSGFEVCKTLKQDDRTKDIPIIFITAKSEVEDETEGLELGAVDFIPKPINPSIVLARVKNHLELKLAQEKLKGQNERLEEHNKYITDSINYAKRIQNAILQNEEQLRELFPESFLIYRPKDIVSGDFYWFGEVDEKKVIAAVDCTGHGVPGSMMSMVGNTLLNEIVKILKVTDPGEILNQLDKRIITELQKGINEQSYDGMDIALCVFDKNEKTISFAGAYRPLYCFRNGILEEYKGERKSIGDKKKIIQFKTQKINYEDGIVLYLFTDGLPDQNNVAGKKYSLARFKSFLQSIQKDKMSIQKEKIVSELDRHQQNEIQRDDITVIGIKCDPAENQKENKPIYSFDYDGLFSQDFLENTVEKFEDETKPLLPSAVFKNFIFCATEFIQNVNYYSSAREYCDKGKDCGVGFFSAYIYNDKVKIKSVNQVTNSQFDKAMFRITHFNSLTPEELKKLKMEKMKSEKEDDSRGGGIGFIEMIRRTGSKVIMNKELLPDKKLSLELTINYKKGDTNE